MALSPQVLKDKINLHAVAFYESEFDIVLKSYCKGNIDVARDNCIRIGAIINGHHQLSDNDQRFLSQLYVKNGWSFLHIREHKGHPAIFEYAIEAILNITEVEVN
jgi:hypothetical protein